MYYLLGVSEDAQHGSNILQVFVRSTATIFFFKKAVEGAVRAGLFILFILLTIYQITGLIRYETN